MLSFFVVTWNISYVAQAADVLLQKELNRLESAKSGGKISSEETVRLAEIYFLTSRCSDATSVLKHLPVKELRPEKKKIANDVLCVCGANCSASASLYKFVMFKKLMASGARWGDRRVQKLWREVEHMPEAKYMVIKRLRTASRHEGVIVRTRARLEKSLESLEIN